MGEDQEDMDPKRGFAGLSSMVSDVESAVAQTAFEAEPDPRAAPAPAESLRSTDDREPDRPIYQGPPQSSGGSSTGKWVLGIGVVAGLLWLVSQSGDKTSLPAPDILVAKSRSLRDLAEEGTGACVRQLTPAEAAGELGNGSVHPKQPGRVGADVVCAVRDWSAG